MDTGSWISLADSGHIQISLTCESSFTQK